MSRAAFRDNTDNRCVGIDDGPFVPRKLGGTRAPLVAVKLDGPRLTSVRVGWISVDGMDATDRAVKLCAGLRASDSPILLAGVTFGGFNIIDPRKLWREFKTPTIAVVGSKPNNRAVKRALVRHFPDWRARWGIIGKLGPLRRVRTVTSENPMYYEAFGCTSGVARKILTNWALVSRVPEPLRVAGLVARGLFSSQPVN
jgi:uncharacterized protein